jgi:hypothetical protein
MNAKKLLVGSVLVNAGLAAALLWPKQTRETAPEAAAPEPETVSAVRSAETKVVTVTTPSAKTFRWHELETSDFHQYMANLRAIGCPEETIRDLVIAEINKLYEPKFAALMAQTQQYDYWKPASRKSREALGKQLDALRAEKRDLLRALLGIEGDPNEQWANISPDELVAQGRFAFLSAEKQKLVREIMARYETKDDVDPRRMREKRREELAQALSPEELYQFELRDSNAADSVRSRFGQADLTEAEYKKLYDLRKAYEDEVGAVANNSDPEKMRKRSEARKLLDEAYKNALGEERLKEINRQQDPGWRSLTQVGQQFNIDQATLDRAYDFQQMAGEQMSKLFSDSNLPREERRKAVDLINAELQRNMAAVLGETAYQEFRNNNGQMTFSTGGDSFVLPGMSPRSIKGPASSSIIINRRVP